MGMPLLLILADAGQTAGEGEHGPVLLGLDAEGWVYVGLSIFLLLAVFVGKVHRRIIDALDSQIAEKRAAIEEAAALRVEAEKLLAAAKAQHAETHLQAQDILAHAEIEAKELIAKADADGKALIARRKKMAEDRIAAAEHAAVADIRQRTAQIATLAARDLIATSHDAAADAKLIDSAIGSLGKALN